ncbi:uncharacterized protein K460DRAFT_405281 [Cucurbitaria berberidis CBS 394.84]|uniref:Uncharacterized protein n=1 Tax=Cucurbitaria berberidis CBS 394.84 TaxID=1168544 RepID=A0A9P4L7G0_9PLEO|nr:uncharacterized protein K460DRAFT_405281 [Cucurbitaria berberidis CBS 394.84]KAF1845001.1 hypothetical protein K460DRAFT_405281 [Cucurbitaria berberidis CBS 394.84]
MDSLSDMHGGKSLTGDRSLLLELPRELRDIIIDYVVCSLNIPPPAVRHDPQTSHSLLENVIIPPLRAILYPLLYTSCQLRAETLQRIEKTDAPIVLDLLLLEDGHGQCTWLNGPSKLGHLNKINMEVRIRTRPVSRELFRARLEKEIEPFSGFTSTRHRQRMHSIESHVQYLIESTIRTAVLGILFDDGLNVEERHNCVSEMADTYQPVNSIAKLRTRINFAVDENGNEMRIPDEQNSRHWFQPNSLPQVFTAIIANNLYHQFLDHGLLWRAARYGKFELICRPLLTHTGKMSIYCGDDNICSRGWDVGEALRNNFTVVDDDDLARKDQTEALRKELGWEDFENGW